MPTGHSLARLADVPDRERRDGGPELVIGCNHPVVAMPVLARRRHEIGEPVEEPKRREFDDAISSRPRGLPSTTPPEKPESFAFWQPVAFFADPRRSPGCGIHASMISKMAAEGG